MNQVLVSAGKTPDTKSLSSGYLNAFKSLNYNCEVYGGSGAFDTFDRFQPDILWVHSDDLTRELTKAIIDRQEIKVILFVNNFEKASTKEKDFVKQLIHNGHNTAFNTSFETRIKQSCGEWGKMGLQTLSCLPAADTTKFKPVPFDSKHSSDISYIGCYEYNKENNFNYFLIPALDKFNIKIYGYGKWPTPYYLGGLNNELINTIICSSKVNLSVSHDEATGPSERIFKILACNKIPLIHASYNEYPELFPMANFFKTRTGLFEQLENMSKMDTTINNKEFILEHCYTNRLKKIFAILGVEQ